jgi:hypothetical protein
MGNFVFFCPRILRLQQLGLLVFVVALSTLSLLAKAAEEVVPKSPQTPQTLTHLAHTDSGQSKKENSSDEGGLKEKSKLLPNCPGSYSKVAWNNCRGIRKEYNGQHFIGQSYSGEFKEGRPNGHGEFIYHDGTRFVGEFEMGIRDGRGTEYAKDGSLIREGYWRAGVLVKTYRTGDSAKSE